MVEIHNNFFRLIFLHPFISISLMSILFEEKRGYGSLLHVTCGCLIEFKIDID